MDEQFQAIINSDVHAFVVMKFQCLVQKSLNLLEEDNTVKSVRSPCQ